ncbi:hypothetical protein LCGC14_3135800, partial [marine sediment metagenome]
AKEKVTKAELVEFIEANGVQVEEVTLGGKVKEDPPLPIAEHPEGWDGECACKECMSRE